MQITKKRLKEIIKEELQSFSEADSVESPQPLRPEEREALDAMIQIHPDELDRLYSMVKARMSVE